MKILLTGASGYIGRRLLPILIEEGHEVIALVRSANRFTIPEHCQEKTSIVVGDLLDLESLQNIPQDIDAAYYLVHSLTQKHGHLKDMETLSAKNFLKALERTRIKQIVYLGGLVNDSHLSPHLSSRKEVDQVLRSGKIPVTTLRAGIILGSGSASFEIIRDLVEKLPIMIAPRWVEKKCQPIGIADVLRYLVSVLDHPKCMSRAFDIGGPDILSYRDILLRFAKVRGLKRYIIGVPVLTPKLSSYWLHFVTSTNMTLAKSLIESLKNNAVCHEQNILNIFPQKCLQFEEALKRTFAKIEENAIVSSWKDAISSSDLNPDLLEYINVPTYGCFQNIQEIPFSSDPDKVIASLWAIGGDNGWYCMNWAWVLRGFIDQLFMGTGLRRGRTHPNRLHAGDALDFWRVLLADNQHGRLLLYAEMRLPGEAWLEFRIIPKEKGYALQQIATFRPNGLLGRLYWFSVSPFHWFIFHGMASAIVEKAQKK
ncbi:MAG: epimerase [Waddliaceae bacterium]|nr:epimerase [Waddliaceae bacterium]